MEFMGFLRPVTALPVLVHKANDTRVQLCYLQQDAFGFL